MGGRAFADAYVPRMPPAVYDIIKNRIHEILNGQFNHVVTPIEGAGKKDYGDVDILVCGPKDTCSVFKEKQYWSVDTEALKNLIGAVDVKRPGNSNDFNFLIPWPQDLDPPMFSSDETEDDDKENKAAGKDAMIQIDIRYVPDLEHFKWLAFINAHGDFCEVMGHMLRKFGLWLSAKGLFLVIPEVIADNKRLARVGITNDPSVALDFLGFDEEKFYKSYKSFDDVCNFIATCRFHDPGRRRAMYEQQAASASKSSDGQIDTAPVAEHDITSIIDTLPTALKDIDLTKPELVKNDLKKFEKRPNIKYWHTVYRPAHVDDPAGDASHMTHEEVLQDAIKIFGPPLEAQYIKQKMEGLRFIFHKRCWPTLQEHVKNIVGEDITAKLAVRGLKRYLAMTEVTEMSFSEFEAVSEARECYSNCDLNGLMEWWKDNWRFVEKQQREFDHTNSAEYRQKLKEKEAAEALKATEQHDSFANDETRKRRKSSAGSLRKALDHLAQQPDRS